MINQTSPMPLHSQLRNLLEKEIMKGSFEKKIPSERDLMERYQLSRTTIREAISSLVHDGLLEKVHGKGTFIKKNPPVHEWMNTLNSFTKTIENTGLEPGSKLIAHGYTNSPKNYFDLLQCPDGYFIERLRYASHYPIAMERHYYSTEIGKKLASYDLNSIVIYDVLEQDFGLQLWETYETISCRGANKKEAELLNVQEKTSLLEMERILYDQTGQSIECLKSVYRPDMFAFKIKRLRNGGSV
ncbi:GntR family transcriptional regulator [Sutcliffiella deserti]|uniref:GntR family transcriptional regulator n=1 Tax=Sutcliffiella deserti TaxID=2875501 RepID=UPI001CC14675|nr:GntR family transcriptional regulator [Sutcliffiella deserti]